MDVEKHGENSGYCPCYKISGVFLKVADLPDTGLEIYHHNYFEQDVSLNIQQPVLAGKPCMSEGILILENTKNEKIKGKDVLLALEKIKIPCPRCRYIYEHVQDLLQDVLVIDKNKVMGICNHCRLKIKSDDPCRVCDKIVNKFKLCKNKHVYDIKSWASETSHKVKGDKFDSYSVKKEPAQSHSDINITKLVKTLIHEPEIKQMFHPRTKANFIEDDQYLEKGGSPEAKITLDRLENYSKYDSKINRGELPEQLDTKYIHKAGLLQNETLIADTDERSIEKQFSFYFPKVIPNITEFKINKVSDTVLINQTKHRLAGQQIEGKTKHTKFIDEPIQDSIEYESLKTKRLQELVKKQLKKKSTEDKPKVTEYLNMEKGTPVKKNTDTQMQTDQLKTLEEYKKYKSLEEKNNKNEEITSREVAGKKVIEDKPMKDKDANTLKNVEPTTKNLEKAGIQDEKMTKKTSDKPPDKPVKPDKKTQTEVDQFKKLKEEYEKEREAEVKRKQIQEIEGKKAREAAEKRLKEEKQASDKKSKTESDQRGALETSKEAKPGPKVESRTVPQGSPILDRKINIQNINKSGDDLLLRLVRTRQSGIKYMETKYKEEKIKERAILIEPKVIKAHKCHHLNTSICELCNDSLLELEVLSIEFNKARIPNVEDIIIGEKIFKHKPLLAKKKDPEVIPILFESLNNKQEFKKEQFPTFVLPSEHTPKATKALVIPPEGSSMKTDRIVQTDLEPKGIIRYSLSDRSFIDKGWTKLPTEKVVRKMNVYRMRPAHPEFDWFEHNKKKKQMTYDDGERLAEFDDNGRGRLYYKNGRLALDYYDAEETNAQQRFVVYSSGEPDERGRTHPITILATFDHLGNGIVFDNAGKIRLKYNQTEGVVLDRGIGPVSHWKWHTLNDPPVLQQVMIDTQMAHKDPQILKLGGPSDCKTRPDNDEMLAIEFDNFIKEKSKKLSQKFKPFQIKMKAMKINEHFALKILDQATVYLIFRDGSTNIKLNLGMVLDHQEIVDTDTAEVGEVSNSLEHFPARTESLAAMQRSVAYAQRYERFTSERERRLRRPEPTASADQLVAATSRPINNPKVTVRSCSTTATGYCRCNKSSSVYYNNRLI